MKAVTKLLIYISKFFNLPSKRFVAMRPRQQCCYSYLGGLLLLLFAQLAVAQKPIPERKGLELKINTEASSTIRDDVRISDETGRPLAVYSPNFVVNAATPELMARQYLTANSGLFGLTLQDLQNLKLHAARTSGAGTTVRLRQFWQELPVLGAEITVTIAPDYHVNMVMNGFRYGINLRSTTPKLTAKKARDLVMAHL